MRTGMMRVGAWLRAVLLPLLLLLLCPAGSAIGQAPPRPFGEERPPWLAMIGRVDPLDPTRYVGVFGDDQSRAVAFFRGGQRLQLTIPQLLERDDEFETARDVMAVIRYPIGDVYVDAGTRVRIGSLDVLFGRVFAKVKGFFSVENQNVVAGVEGTEFAFEVARDGSTEITVLDGTVLSSSKRLPWKPLRVTRNQAFWVTNSGMQMKVGAPTAMQLAQLRRWVDRADAAVAVLAPREAQAQPAPQPPPPEPQPQQPVPPPMQPVPQPVQPIPPPVIVVPIPPVVTDPSGYCCDPAGRVYPSTAGVCRGRLYQFEADAYARCARNRPGFCCANNRIFETTASQCRGIFSYDQARLAESCGSPPGYCCTDNGVLQTTQNLCKGNFYNDASTARRLCQAPPPMGYCCAAGQVLQTDRAHCRGNYYVDEAAAIKACKPVIGAPSTDGPVVRKPPGAGKVIQTPPPDAKGTQKFPSDAAKTKTDTGQMVKKPALDALKTKPDTSQMIKKPPPEPPPIKLNRLPVTAPTASAHRARWS